MNLPHIKELDSVRAFAVALVISQHWNFAGMEHYAIGLFGVRLFFVLSGFLITGILLESREALQQGSSIGRELRTFYIRRSLRIFPVYYLVLTLTTLIGFDFIKQNLGWHLLYGTNLLIGLDNKWPGTGVHLWSLAVEEQFYLLWPLLLLSLGTRAVAPVLLALVVSAPIWRWALMSAGFGHIPAFTAMFGCLDALGSGALLAYAMRSGWNTRSWTLPFAAAGFALIWVDSDFAPALISAAVINFVVLNRDSSMLGFMRFAPITYIGTISYGLYLYHPFVPMTIGPLLPPLDSKVEILLFSITTLFVAAASWELFEKPINRLKRHFPYQRNAASASHAEAESDPKNINENKRADGFEAL